MQADTRESVMNLEAEVEALRRDFADYKDRQASEESRRLRSAMMLLGGVVLAVFGFMWAEVVWPAIKMMKAGG